MDIGIIGLERGGLAKGDNGFPELPAIDERGAKVVVGFGIVGLERDGFIVGGNRFRELPAMGERAGDAMVGFGICLLYTSDAADE